MTEPLSKLLAAIGPFTPSCIPTTSDWESLERDLSVTLPLDYKETVSRLGACSFGDSLNLLSPRARSPGLRQSLQVQIEYADYFAELENTLGVHFVPNGLGLFLVATTPTRLCLFMDLKEPKAVIHPATILDPDEPAIERHYLSFPEFLHEFVHGRINTECAGRLYTWSGLAQAGINFQTG